MSKDDDQVKLLVLESFLKPVLLYSVFHSLHHCVISISGKIENESKRQDPDSLILRLELLEPRSKWY